MATETAKLMFKFWIEMAAMGDYFANSYPGGGKNAHTYAHMAADDYYRMAGLDF
jgi:hypothetical protein